MKKLVSMLALALSITACAVEGDLDETSLGETAQASTVAYEEGIYLDRKPIFVSWENMCKSLNGTSRFTDLYGCTTETTRSNCHRTAQGCSCSVTVEQTGNCN